VGGPFEKFTYCPEIDTLEKTPIWPDEVEYALDHPFTKILFLNVQLNIGLLIYCQIRIHIQR